MLRATYRDRRSGKVLELEPHSFARLLQYVESRVFTKPKLLNKTRAFRRIPRRDSRRAQRRSPIRLVPTLREVLMVFLVMIVIYVAIAYLRAVLDRAMHLIEKVMMEYLGS